MAHLDDAIIAFQELGTYPYRNFIGEKKDLKAASPGFSKKSSKEPSYGAFLGERIKCARVHQGGGHEQMDGNHRHLRFGPPVSIHQNSYTDKEVRNSKNGQFARHLV